MLRAIIVDDEELSVKRLKRILSESGEIDVRRTFLNPMDAFEFVKMNPIDIAFLDISMPGISGIGLSNHLSEHDDRIDVVFVSGYEDYAIQAFEISALDYLLKPVTTERVSITLDKIRRRHRKASVQPTLEVQLFDGLKIYRRSQKKELLKMRSPKTEELFAFLIYKGTVSREEIIDTLWKDLEPEKAWKNLNSTLYYVRKAISESDIGNVILTGKNEIQIVETSISCDLYQFEQLMKQIRRSPERSIDIIEQVEALYTGPLLKGKAYEWISEKALRLEQNYIEILELAARFHLKHNQVHQSLTYFEEILKLDAFREDITHEVIRLYIELGRTNEALRQFRMLEELLREELGTKPDSLTEALIQKLKS